MPEPSKELLTRYAKEANDLALAFVRALGEEKIDDYVPKLSDVESDSTAGGALAQQQLRLVSKTAGKPPLMIGSVNVKEQTAELRAWERVDAQHHRHFGSSLPIARDPYDAFLEKARTFFENGGLRTTVVAGVDAPFREAPGGASKVFVFIAGLLVGIAVTWVFMIMRR